MKFQRKTLKGNSKVSHKVVPNAQIDYFLRICIIHFTCIYYNKLIKKKQFLTWPFRTRGFKCEYLRRKYLNTYTSMQIKLTIGKFIL